MGRRYDIDWDAIERSYRIGQFTIREIAKLHLISRSALIRRAKKHGWIQDLSEEVRIRTAAGLLENPLSKATQSYHPSRARDTEEAIDAAVRTNIEVVRQHRNSIGSAHGLAVKMLADLKATRDANAEIVEEIIEETKGDKDGRSKPNTKRRNDMVKAVKLPGQAQTLVAISSILGKVIPLERKAFGLDDDKGEDPDAPLMRFRKEISGNALRPVEEPERGQSQSPGSALTPENASER